MIRWLLCLTLIAFTNWQEVLKTLPASILIAPAPPAPRPVVAQDPVPEKSESPAKPEKSDKSDKSEKSESRTKTDARNAKAATSALVNINTATVQELDGLPGIGLHMAQRIVDYRQKNGAFKRVEDLMGVQGIGEKNFQKLKPLITIGAQRQ